MDRDNRQVMFLRPAFPFLGGPREESGLKLFVVRSVQTQRLSQPRQKMWLKRPYRNPAFESSIDVIARERPSKQSPRNRETVAQRRREGFCRVLQRNLGTNRIACALAVE